LARSHRAVHLFQRGFHVVEGQRCHPSRSPSQIFLSSSLATRARSGASSGAAKATRRTTRSTVQNGSTSKLVTSNDRRVSAPAQYVGPRMRGYPCTEAFGAGRWVVSQVAPGGSDRTQPADLDSAGRPRASIGACRSRTNADDCLPPASLGRV